MPPGDDLRSNETLRRAGKILGYLALGLVGTAVVALVVLNVTRPVQPVVYDLFYLQAGPSGATETAILTHFVGASAVALTVPTVLGDYFSDGLAHRREVGKAVAWILSSLVAFLVAALVGLGAFRTALVVLAAVFVGVPLLFYRQGVRSGAVPAFVGGIPVVVLFLLLAGFGLGWGWGYVVTAEEVPESSVNGTAATFEEVPAVREDLFESGDCETDPDGRRVCLLSLRGYDHETVAARFLAAHGVRCPYQNAPSAGGGSVVARHDGTYYRVRCSPHGD